MKTKRHFSKIFLVAVVCVMIFNPTSVLASGITVEKMIELTNKSRNDSGLKSLIYNEQLALAAEKKAADMFDNQYFEHTSPDGVTPWFWFEEVGYDYYYAAENLAIDFTTAEGAHKAFMKSTGHRENILGVNYNEVGIAAVTGMFEGRETIIVVEEFGSTQQQEIEVENSEVFFERVMEANEIITFIEQSYADEESFEEITVSEEIAVQEEGFVLPKMLSIKNPLALKKVYTENIYWEDFEESGVLVAANSYRIKIKDILDILEKKIMETEF
ncbi:MAG: CAP domain-containing protein [Candidatus Pacebacteria bacterium]|nr:CAP domain-containing protein [Candidatus Paceibacterota bacterium]